MVARSSKPTIGDAVCRGFLPFSAFANASNFRRTFAIRRNDLMSSCNLMRVTYAWQRHIAPQLKGLNLRHIQRSQPTECVCSCDANAEREFNKLHGSSGRQQHSTTHSIVRTLNFAYMWTLFYSCSEKWNKQQESPKFNCMAWTLWFWQNL